MSSGFVKLFEKEVEKSKMNVKPSTELIPDEYDVQFTGNECVHIFVAEKDLIGKCKKFFECINVEISESNIHFLVEYSDVQKTLVDVAGSRDDYSLLFLIFWGYSKDDGEFTLNDNTKFTFIDTWSKFITSSNTNFRDIPKVFIYNVVKFSKTTEVDGYYYQPPPNAYDVPGEADLLIIYKHNSSMEESQTFMDELGENLKQYGKTEDLSSVVSIIDTASYTRPVLISTMLKKLYMIPSELRGHYLNFETSHDLTMQEMQKINELLTYVRKEKIQSSPSLYGKIKNKVSASFRSKSGTNNEKSKEIVSVEKGKKIIEDNACSTEFKKPLALAGSNRSITPRTSTDRNARRPSVVKKISVEERKPWKP